MKFIFIKTGCTIEGRIGCFSFVWVTNRMKHNELQLKKYYPMKLWIGRLGLLYEEAKNETNE